MHDPDTVSLEDMNELIVHSKLFTRAEQALMDGNPWMDVHMTSILAFSCAYPGRLYEKIHKYEFIDKRWEKITTRVKPCQRYLPSIML